MSITLKQSATVGLAIGIALLVAPQTSALSSNATGDTDLINAVREVYAGTNYVPNAPKAAVAYIDGNTNTIKLANFDSGATDRYEIASISKTFFANLYADALEDGVVTKQTQLKQHTPVRVLTGNKTLESLATHKSGLPSYAAPQQLSIDLANGGANKNVFNNESFRNLYTAGNIVVYYPNAGQYQYSNLGYALLGDAVGRAKGYDGAVPLVTQEVLSPLGMTNTTVPWKEDDLTTDDLQGTTASGQPAERWTVGSYAPAGGLHSTIGDMGKYALAILRGDVAGVDEAMAPKVAASTTVQSGYSWQTEVAGGRTYVHHGGTHPGFNSMIAFDREKNTAVVMLANQTTQDRNARFEAARSLLDRNGQ